ncbi:MAG: Radical SAM domain protein, partial [Candidatus Gottesmanbacteria bacterium GW2011_GWA2_47_9]
MKIILVFPTINKSDYGLPRTPPLGISYLGTVLEQNGHKVKLIDLRLPDFGNEYFVSTLRSFKPDIVGVSATSYGYLSGKEIFELTKAYSKRTLTILGGPHAAVGGLVAIKDKNLDMLAVGEGEELIIELLDALRNKKSFKSIKGLTYKDRRGRVHINEPRRTGLDVNTLPFPKLDFFPLEKYKAAGVLTLPIMTSRGCPYGCIYCVSFKTQGKLFRGRSAQNVVDEIESLTKKTNADHF